MYAKKTAIYILLLSFLQIAISQSIKEEACKTVIPSDIDDPCNYTNLARMGVIPCRNSSGRITDMNECRKNISCCWAQDQKRNPCFLKPKKCYVDLRREKCYSNVRYGNGIQSGIFTGFSANGSYCFVPTLDPVNEEIKSKLGQLTGYGFHIEKKFLCVENWDVEVTSLSPGTCNITIFNKTGSFPFQETPKSIPGQLQFSSYCIHTQNGIKYVFEYFPNKPRYNHCVCKVDAWTEDENEELPVSEKVKNYIKNLENRSSCSQILGMFLRSSWLQLVSLTNREEANEIMNALVELTNKSSEVSLSEVSVFLDSAKKVANYSFYEGFEEKSADIIMKQTTFMASQLIETFMKNQIPDDIYSAASHNDENKITLEEKAYKKSQLKHELFNVMDSMSVRVASRVNHQTNESGIQLRAPEKHVDLSLVVAKSLKDVAQQKLHQSNFNISKTDQVSVIEIPENNLIDLCQDQVAMVSLFYDYPPSETDPNRRVSNYLTVNVWKIHAGETEKISVRVNFTLARDQHIFNDKSKYIPSCSFLLSNTSNEIWSDFGCKTINYHNSTTCVCNHTTNFAVLMKITGSNLDGENDQALKIITIVLGFISIACLGATLFVFIAYRKTLMKDRMLIHFHLIVALLLAYVSMLPTSLLATHSHNNEQHSNDVSDNYLKTTEGPVTYHVQTPIASCIACALLIHYFYLAVYFWALVEGIYLFYKIVLVFNRKWVEAVQKFSPVIGWICPLIIVVISFSLSRTVLRNNENSNIDAYVNPSTCFLNVDNHMIWAFFGPVLVIIVINIIIVCKISLVIYKSTYTSNRMSSMENSARISASMKKSGRGAIILLPILGIPIVVNILYNFYNGNGSVESNVGQVVGVIGAYLQVFQAGVQGIAIFFFYCLYNEEVRNAYKLAKHRRKSLGSLEVSSSKRKQSRLPLLFSRGDGNTYTSSTSLDQIKNNKKILTIESKQTAKRELSPNKSHAKGYCTGSIVYGRTQLCNGK